MKVSVHRLAAAVEVSIPGAWHAVVIVRRADVVDDAQAAFAFTVDPVTAEPSFE